MAISSSMLVRRAMLAVASAVWPTPTSRPARPARLAANQNILFDAGDVTCDGGQVDHQIKLAGNEAVLGELARHGHRNPRRRLRP